MERAVILGGRPRPTSPSRTSRARTRPATACCGGRATGSPRPPVVDAAVNTTYMNVVHMVEHPRALTRPGLLLRAARVLLDGRA
ncbi:hypothetical protein [Streptomyces sp. NPDC046385]|uniref:hypothetical protein n=1 Tax=Streptomyces sp. NPDC046385 TaxID=3154918 RepID=UPI0033E18C22